MGPEKPPGPLGSTLSFCIVRGHSFCSSSGRQRVNSLSPEKPIVGPGRSGGPAERQHPLVSLQIHGSPPPPGPSSRHAGEGEFRHAYSL